jgi:ABC-2 type transport system permease protein
MKKYWAIFKITWQNSLQYRVQFLVHMIRGIIFLIVLIFIWRSVFNQVENFGGYTFSSMLTYLVMIRFIHFTNRGNTGRLIADEIKNGDLSKYLLKPVNYLKFWFCSFWADRLFDALTRITVLIGFLVLMPGFFKLTSFKSALLFVLFLPLSLVFNFLLNVFLATFAFWVTDVRLFTSIVGLTTGFLAGGLIPLDILPGFLKSLSLLLPFQYTLYFPIKIYQGTLSNWEIIRGVFTSFVWLGAGFWFLNYFWQKGVRKYEAVGQ